MSEQYLSYFILAGRALEALRENEIARRVAEQHHSRRGAGQATTPTARRAVLCVFAVASPPRKALLSVRAPPVRSRLND